MRKTASRRALRAAYKAEQNTYEPICITLKKARSMLGISQARIAVRMGVPPVVWAKYENGALRVPTSILLKLLMFGLDFWTEQDL